jgi:hypothetical protein
MERREKEIGLIRDKAESCLRRPVCLLPTLPRTDYATILRLWHSPAFHANKSWCVYQPTGVNSSRYKSAVVETCWDAPGDYKRMSDPLEGLKSGFLPEPTMMMRFTAFDFTDYSELLSQKHSMALAIVSRPECAGCDGEVWGFENFDYFQGLRLQWWCEGPGDWQPLVKSFHKLLAAIQEALEVKDYEPYQRELRVEPWKEFISS